MIKVEHTPQTWKLSLSDFNLGKWGTVVNGFKVPASMIKRFRKQITNADGTISDVFDADKAFDEIAITFINAIVASYEILRITHFMFLEEDTRDALRKAVYNAIEFGCLNKQLWEMINTSQISMPNINIDINTVSWVLSKDMIGMKADNYITKSGLEDYMWVQEDNLSLVTKNGNIRVIGKVKLEELPDLSANL